MEPAVLAVLGRALAVAPPELLRRVVVAGEVGGLDAPRRARRLRAADLAQHDEPCMHVTGGQSRHQATKLSRARTEILVVHSVLDSTTCQLTGEEDEGEGELHGGHDLFLLSKLASALVC